MKKAGFPTPVTDQLEASLEDVRRGDVRALPAASALPPATAFSALEIRAKRESLNMTQSEFAELLQVAAKTVQAWEAGRRSPSPGQARWIEMFTGPEWLDRLRMPTPHPRAPRKMNVEHVEAPAGDREPVGPQRKTGGRSRAATPTSEDSSPGAARVASANRPRPLTVTGRLRKTDKP